MEDSKRVLIALVLSVVVLWIYSAFVAPPAKPPQEQSAQNTAKEKPAASQAKGASPADTSIKASPAQAPAAGPAAAPVKGKTITVETPLLKARFNELGGELRHLELRKYYNNPEKQGGNFVLVNLDDQPSGTLGVNLPPALTQLGQTPFVSDRSSLTLSEKNPKGDIVFTTTQGALKIEKIYRFQADTYAVDLEVKVTNTGNTPVELTPEIQLNSVLLPHGQNSYAFTGLQYMTSGKLNEKDLSDLEEQQVGSGNVSWMCLTETYFMGSIVPLEKGTDLKRSVRGVAPKGKAEMHGILVDTPCRVEPGAQVSRKYMVFHGPRDLDILEPLGHDLALSVDFGWFDIIARPMLMFLKIIHGMGFNYGIAIIIVTILTKILFWPLAQKSYKSMKQMQKLQPQVARLREKYKNDKQRMNQEMMQLYKTYKVNPMGGCIPMLVQIPVFIAFYKVLGSSIQLRHAPFMLWINDLAAPDRLSLGFDLPYVGGLPVLTLLMGASMFIQQKMTPTTADPTQAKMMLLMPVVFTFLFINFPAGLVLYWLVNNVLSIGQQYLINKSKA